MTKMSQNAQKIGNQIVTTANGQNVTKRDKRTWAHAIGVPRASNIIWYWYVYRKILSNVRSTNLEFTLLDRPNFFCKVPHPGG